MAKWITDKCVKYKDIELPEIKIEKLFFISFFICIVSVLNDEYFKIQFHTYKEKKHQIAT